MEQKSGITSIKLLLAPCLAIVVFAMAQLVLAQEQGKRFGPMKFFFLPTTYISRYQSFLAAPKKDEQASELSAAGGDAALADLTSLTSQRGLDDLAESYIRSTDGYIATLHGLSFFSSYYGRAGLSNEEIKRMIGQVSNIMELPDGSKVVMPIERSHYLHQALMRAIARKAKAMMPSPQLVGDYEATVEGPCPIKNGPLRLDQADFVVEGVQEDALVMVGAVGSTRAYFLFSEDKYIAAKPLKGGGLDVSVPDRPSVLYESKVDQKSMVLSGVKGGACRIILSRLR